MSIKKTLPTIHVIAQSHIDLAWLWRWDPETVQVCCKLTFGNAVANLDKFPEYKFTQSQPPLYEATEQNHPEIFQKIKQYVKENRWELAGAMYVEAEGGEPSGESLVRQCIHGKHYFMKRFGKNVTTAWQEDSWSHPWQLPQIYKLCGVDAYFFKRGRQNPEIFWWESPDGTRMFSINPVNILRGFRDLHDAPRLRKWIAKNMNEYRIRNIMVRIGRGDHGGGPKVSEIQRVLSFAQKNIDKYNVIFDTFENYKNALLNESGRIPIIKEEIGNELQGDLTNCCEIKQNNRMCELLLLDVEKIATIASLIKLNHKNPNNNNPNNNNQNDSYPHKPIYELWNKLLFNQFHDIIGGSCIPEANQDAFLLYDEIKKQGTEILFNSLRSLMNTSQESDIKNDIHVTLFNPLSWDRSDIVQLRFHSSNASLLNDLEIKDSKGSGVVFQLSEFADSVMVSFITSIPSCGFTKFSLQSQAFSSISPNLHDLTNQNILNIFSTECHPSVFKQPSTHPSLNRINNQYLEIENEFYRIRVSSSTGNIIEMYDKNLRMNIFDDSQQGNALIAIADMGDSEGRFKRKSDIINHPLGERSLIGLEFEADDPRNFELIASGPLYKKIRIHKKFQNSRFIQEIILNNSKATVDFELCIDWHDVHTMIKILFPIRPPYNPSNLLNIQDPVVTYHTAYGTIEHPANGFEYPMQYWVDVSYDETEKYGVSLFNRTRNACDVLKNTIGLSVLRSPTEPSPNNEEGYHHISYSLYPHAANWREALVMQKAIAFNTDILPYFGRLNSNVEDTTKQSSSFFRISPKNVIIEVIKPVYDVNQDELILRCYEFEGKESETSIESFFPIEDAYKTDLLEQNKLEKLFIESSHLVRFKIRSYEIYTIRIVIKRDN